MPDFHALPVGQVQFYATAPYACSYLPNRLARSQVATPSQSIDDARYSQLLHQGFRRSGSFTYRPYCGSCHACIALRVKVNAYQPNRSQRRAWAHHQHLTTRVVDLRFDAQHYDLYQRYQAARHAGGGMDEGGRAQYEAFLLQSHVNTRLVEFRAAHGSTHEASQSEQLKMVSLIDIVQDGISAVYTFYEPEPLASYGTYNVMWQIELARQLKLPYLYLGYWIEESAKMRYKENFRPHQRLIQGAWQDINFT